MRSRVLALLLALPLTVSAQARTLPEPEIGFRAGIQRLSFDDGAGGIVKATFITLPGMMFGSPGGVHFTLFVTEKLALEPHLGFLRTSGDGFTNSQTFLAIQPEYFLGPDARRAPYLFAQLGVVRNSNSGGGSSNSESRNVFGGGVGYRKVLRRVIATRYELRFRQISGDAGQETNEVALLFGLGVVIPRSSQ